MMLNPIRVNCSTKVDTALGVIFSFPWKYDFRIDVKETTNSSGPTIIRGRTTRSSFNRYVEMGSARKNIMIVINVLRDSEMVSDADRTFLSLISPREIRAGIATGNPTVAIVARSMIVGDISM